MRLVVTAWIWMRIASIGLAMALVRPGGMSAAQAQSPDLKLELFPEDKLVNAPVQLTIRVTTREPLQNARLILRVPDGITVRQGIASAAVAGDSLVVALGTVTAQAARTVMLSGDRGLLGPGRYKCQVELVTADSAGTLRTVASQEVSLSAGLQISLPAYLLLGAIGIGLGKVMNWLIIALRDRRAELAKMMEDDALTPLPKGIKKFVSEHYYRVDFGVAIALGLVLLLGLVGAGGILPEKAATPHGAFLLGFGVGFLTDTDLLTRIKQRTA